MILTFSEKRFERKIIDKEKIHTIRKDVGNKWRTGVKINFWMHNPRNVQLYPYEFATSHTRKVDNIIIMPGQNKIIIENNIFVSLKDLNNIAVRDGFDDFEHFKTWFDKPFSGKLIHWSLDYLRASKRNKKNSFYAKQGELF